MKKVTIIGAGIGGLTTAIALKQKGVEVEIFENTPEFHEAGSGINLAANAMQIFKRLGVYEDVLKNACTTKSMNLRTKNLGFLASSDLGGFESEFGVRSAAIHRAKLHNILLDHLDGVEIHLNKKLKSLEQKDDLVHLIFEDGSSQTAELVIGADGIHSNVRKALFDDTRLRDAGQLCWRGISNAKIDAKHLGELNEIWGRGNRFGFVHITDEQVYWFALVNKKQGLPQNTNLLDVFKDYHPTVHDIINETPKEKILFNELWDLNPIDSWHKGNVCLLGDAAHATTPNLGQGACQAIESAMALSICLAEEKSVESAFSRYESIRKEKAIHIVNTSWRIGKMAQSNNPLLVFVRNMVLRLAPGSVMKKQNRKTFELNF